MMTGVGRLLRNSCVALPLVAFMGGCAHTIQVETTPLVPESMPVVEGSAPAGHPVAYCRERVLWGETQYYPTPEKGKPFLLNSDSVFITEADAERTRRELVDPFVGFGVET